MPLYVFRCPACPDVELAYPMAHVPDQVSCRTCAAPARRVVSAGRLAGDTRALRLIDATRSTAQSPPVVGAVPGSRRVRRPVSRDPRHRRLPRP